MSAFAERNSTCSALDGLGVGIALPLVVADQSQNVGCFVNTASISLSASVQVIRLVSDRMLASQYDGTFALFRAQVSIGSCTGMIEIAFKTPSSRPLDQKVAGQYPPFLVERLFSPDPAASCPSLSGMAGPVTCGDTWVGTLSPS